MQKKLFISRTVTQVDTTDIDGTGALRWIGNNCYRYVKFGTTVTQGYPVFSAASTVATVTGIATKGASTNLMFLAGIACTDVNLTTAAGATATLQYGWIQVHGHNSTVSILDASGTTYTAGMYMKGVNAQWYLTMDAQTQPLYKRNVQLLEEIATATTTLLAAQAVAAYVNCLD